MVDAVAPALSTASAAAAPIAERRQDDAEPAEPSFRAVLSALNPLQYLPVVGTIYRAATGDEVPEPVRRIGSAVGSFLLGGPVGVAINLATLLAEKVSGIDLDRSGQALLAALVGSPAPSNPSVPIEEHGDPEPLSEADALNARELERLHAADRPALALASAASPPHVMEEWTGPAARSSERVAGPAHGAAPVHRSATLREQAGAAHDHVAAPREHAAIVRDRTEMARDQSTATDDLWTAARARAAYDRAAGLAGFASQGLG